MIKPTDHHAIAAVAAALDLTEHNLVGPHADRSVAGLENGEDGDFGYDDPSGMGEFMDDPAGDEEPIDPTASRDMSWSWSGGAPDGATDFTGDVSYASDRPDDLPDPYAPGNDLNGTDADIEGGDVDLMSLIDLLVANAPHNQDVEADETDPWY